MAKTTANFRALREITGVSQQLAAEALGVSLVTVKKWERGERTVPADAMRWMLECVKEHDAGVAHEVEAVTSSVPRGSEVCLTYYRTQEQADLAARPEKAGPYTFLNAVARSAAERLVLLGYPVSFRYPDEEMLFDGNI